MWFRVRRYRGGGGPKPEAICGLRLTASRVEGWVGQKVEVSRRIHLRKNMVRVREVAATAWVNMTPLFR